MRFFLSLVTIIALFFLTISQALADYGFTAEEVGDNSVTLSWDDVEAADFYQVSYGTSSSSSGVYDESSQILDTTSYELIGLEGDTEYYMVVEGFDDAANSVFMSEELTVTTGGSVVSSSSSDFAIVSAEQIGADTIALSFSNPISPSQDASDREFKIEAVDDSSDYIDVFMSEIDPNDENTLNLTLDAEPSDGVEYRVVVVSLEDVNGNTIEFGVNSETSFLGGYDEDLNAAGPSVTEEKQETVEDTKKQTEKTEEKKQETKGAVSGKNLSDDELSEDVHSVSEEKEDLPQTGPEHVILLFVALLASALFFVPKYLKK